MILDRVTITGADDSIEPADLLQLTLDFPFVEWAILISGSAGSEGRPRFPSRTWLQRFKDYVHGSSLQFQLSLHVCGRQVRQLLQGQVEQQLLEDASFFQRVQLNFHALNEKCAPEAFYKALLKFKPCQFIFQIDGSNGNEHYEAILLEDIEYGDPKLDAVPLFDVSGGAGIVPAEWPQPAYKHVNQDFLYHGYAGGLGPDTLEQQLPLIAKAAGDIRVWVDMETRVRSPDDALFDLAKVRRCLEICAPFVTQPAAAT